MKDTDIEIIVTDDEERKRTVKDGETVCLEPGEYTVTAKVVNTDDVAGAIDAADLASDVAADDVEIDDEFEKKFVVKDCGDDKGRNIDDRDQTNVCNNVVNIIVRDNQNVDVSADQYANVQAGQYANVGDVSNEQVVDIAQELNVSPVIVQQCIQQAAGDDTVIVFDGDRDGDGKNGNGKNGNGNGGNGAAGEQYQDDVLADTIPGKLLPNTGGPAVLLPAAALLLISGAVIRLIVRRKL